MYYVSIEESHDLGAGAGGVGAEGGGAGAGGDVVFHCPEDGLIVIAAGDVCKGVVGADGLRAACCPPKEGYDLRTRTACVWAERGFRGTRGHARYNRPVNRIVRPVSFDWHIRELVAGAAFAAVTGQARSGIWLQHRNDFCFRFPATSTGVGHDPGRGLCRLRGNNARIPCMTKCRSIGINIAVAANTGVDRVPLLSASRCDYGCCIVVGVPCCRNWFGFRLSTASASERFNAGLCLSRLQRDCPSIPTVAQRACITIFVTVSTDRASMGGVSLIGARRRGNGILIIMPQRFN